MGGRDITDVLNGSSEDRGAVMRGVIGKAKSNGVPPTGRKLTTTTLASEKAVKREFIFDDRIPLGGVTQFVGPGGVNKSTMTNFIGAAGSVGSLSGALLGQPFDTIFFSYEDDGGLMKLRANAMGADTNRLHVVRVSDNGEDDLFTIPDDLHLLDEHLGAHPEVKLVVIDPWSSAVSGDVDTHREAPVKRVLTRLAAIAMQHNVAIIVVSHLNKAQSVDIVARMSGSAAGHHGVRSVLSLGRHPEDEEGGDRRILVHPKSNWGREQPALEFTRREVEVTDDTGQSTTVPVLDLVGESSVTTSAVLSQMSEDDRSERDEAEIFLREELRLGPVSAKVILKNAGAAGIAERTLRRAKKALQVESVKEGDGWSWGLPTGRENAPEPKAATFGRRDGKKADGSLERPMNTDDSGVPGPKIATHSSGSLAPDNPFI